MASIVMITLSLAVFAALALTLRKPRMEPSARFAHDYDLLKAEQTRLEAQIAAGDVAPGDASVSRNELRRRVLALQRLAEAAPDLADQPIRAAYVGVAAVVVLGAGFYIWSMQGTTIEASPPLPSAAQERGGASPSDGFEALMTRGQARFADGNFAGAFDAYEAAGAADPRRVEAWLAQGEALVAAEKGQISPAAMLSFARAEQVSPGNPVTQYYSGLERFQQGDAAAAQAIWRALKVRSRPTAPWMPQLNRGLEAAAQALGEEREPQIGLEQIEGMVAGLAARLGEQPDDPEGWLMLARSYMVLGRSDDAQGALTALEGLANVPADIAAGAAQMRATLTQK